MLRRFGGIQRSWIGIKNFIVAQQGPSVINTVMWVGYIKMNPVIGQLSFTGPVAIMQSVRKQDNEFIRMNRIVFLSLCDVSRILLG